MNTGSHRYEKKESSYVLSVLIRVNLWLNIFQNLHRRIPSARSHNAAAGMRCRSAHVKVLDWRAILCPTRRRSQKEKLFQGQLALENISFGQTKFAFEIEWRQDLSMKNDSTDIWRMLGNRI